MPSNNRLWVIAACALLGGCGGGNRLPRAADVGGPPPVYGQYGGSGYRAPAQYPSSVPPEFSGPGATYSPQSAPAPQYPQPDYQQPAPQPAYPDQQGGAGYSPPPYGEKPEVYTPPPRQQPQQYYPPQQTYQAPQPAYQPQPSYAPPATSQVLGRDDRYDAVGYADWAAQAGTVAGAHRSLPIGSFVEVTNLMTGTNVLVPITARSSSGREIELSGSAAQLLGFGPRGPAPVRVRRVVASGADETALRMGRPAPPRVDTPPVLLNALRHKLDGTLGQAPPGTIPAPEPDYTPPTASIGAPGASYAPPGASYAPPRGPAARPPAARAPAQAAPVRIRPGFYVQLAALANAANATALARQLGAGVQMVGGLYAVRLGPFADVSSAQRARDAAAQRGYANARIAREN